MKSAPEINVPFTHNLKCPVCHTLLDIVVVTTIGFASARITGGSTFHSNVGVSLEEKPLKLVIEKHECDIKNEN